jgi:hypothetical protein
MRTLLCVPIIHTSADLGSLAPEVHRRGVKNFGNDAWEAHLGTIDAFWDALDAYFDSIPVAGAKVFQDGMIADGELGLRIIQEVEKAGSKNHRLVSKLLQRGAILMRTEDFALVKKERDRLLKIIQAKTTVRKFLGLIAYKLSKKKLLRQRDESIARRINQTLGEGETGILFIGAYHTIMPRLARDILIREIKDVGKIREYQSLLPAQEKNKNRFEDLSRYLAAKIGEGA